MCSHIELHSHAVYPCLPFDWCQLGASLGSVMTIFDDFGVDSSSVFLFWERANRHTQTILQLTALGLPMPRLSPPACNKISLLEILIWLQVSRKKTLYTGWSGVTVTSLSRYDRHFVGTAKAAVGTEFLSPYPSHTHRKSCGYPHRIPIPTEPQKPTYPYPHPVFSLQEAYFSLLCVILTVGYYQCC